MKKLNLNIKLSNKQQKIIILASIFIMMMILNFITPLLADDYSYALGIDNQKLENLYQIFLKQQHHYFNWGGRIVSHSIACVFLMFSKNIFNILNALIYTLLVYLIYKISINNKEEKPIFLILIHFALYFITPVFGQSCIWLIGSCNYLWTTTGILLFLLNYIKPNKNDKIIKIISLFLFGIIVGWTNENTSFGLIVITTLMIICKPKNKKNEKYKISGLIGVIIGFIAMIIAPGNFERNKEFVDNNPFIRKIIKRFVLYTIDFKNLMLIPIIILILLISYYIYKKKKLDKKVYIFIAGAIFAIYSMLLSPTFPERAWFGITVFFIIAIFMLLSGININRLKKIIMLDITLILCFVYIGDYLYLLRDINALKINWDYRINTIKEGKKQGIKDFEFDYFYTVNRKSPIYGLADISGTKHYWPNDAVEHYYNINSIKGKSSEN